MNIHTALDIPGSALVDTRTGRRYFTTAQQSTQRLPYLKPETPADSTYVLLRKADHVHYRVATCDCCHRVDERTARGLRRIRLDAAGECRACRDVSAQFAARQRRTRKAVR